MTAFWVPLKLCTHGESPSLPTTLEGANMTAMEGEKHSCSKWWRLRAKWGTLLEKSAFQGETGLPGCNSGHVDRGVLTPLGWCPVALNVPVFHWEREASLPHSTINKVQLVKYLRLMFNWVGFGGKFHLGE